jgi:hypothetical protein
VFCIGAHRQLLAVCAVVTAVDRRTWTYRVEEKENKVFIDL